MKRRHIRHRGWFTTLIVLVLIVVGLRVYGIDDISLRIAWYRIRLLSDRPQTGVEQVERLVSLGERGTRHLIWCVGHDVDEVQVAAIDVLRQWRVKRASPAFIRVLDDGNPKVRAGANFALEQISGVSVGFDAYAAWANRRNEVRLWKEWWMTQQQSGGSSTASEVIDRLGVDRKPAADRP